MKPPTIKEFAAILNKNGFQNAYQTYEEIKEKCPEFSLTKDDIGFWVYQLYSNKKYKKAIELLKLSTKLNPESPDAWEWLGRIYWETGDKELAEKSLEKMKELKGKLNIPAK